MIRQGDTVTLKPAYMDKGDDKFEWKALQDEDGGRVLIAPQGTGLEIVPSYVVRVEWLA